MLRKTKTIAVTAIAALGVTGVAAAEVIFDPATGGSVGKGDVQLPFGYNNDQLQQNAEKIAFRYTEQQDFEVVCSWQEEETEQYKETFTNAGGTHTRTATRTILVPKNETRTAVSDKVLDQNPGLKRAKKNTSDGQVVGFTISGFSITHDAPSGVCADGETQESAVAVGDPRPVSLKAAHIETLEQHVMWSAPAPAAAVVESDVTLSQIDG